MEVNFISGRKAILTIYKDGAEQEKVTLSDYDDTDKLHSLFVEKGFEKYAEEEMVAQRKMKEAQQPPPAGGGGGGLRNKNKNARPGQPLSPKLKKTEMKEKLRKLKEAREKFAAGAPR